MATQWDEIRKEFPAASRHVWLNAASCGLTPRVVREAVERFQRELEEDADLHWEPWILRRDKARAAVARLIGAERDEGPGDLFPSAAGPGSSPPDPRGPVRPLSRLTVPRDERPRSAGSMTRNPRNSRKRRGAPRSAGTR